MSNNTNASASASLSGTPSASAKNSPRRSSVMSKRPSLKLNGGGDRKGGELEQSMPLFLPSDSRKTSSAGIAYGNRTDGVISGSSSGNGIDNRNVSGATTKRLSASGTNHIDFNVLNENIEDASCDDDIFEEIEKNSKSKYEYKQAEVIPIVVVPSNLGKPFNNVKKFVEIAKEEEREKNDHDKEYEGMFFGGIRSAFEKEMAEYAESKKKFVGGPFRNFSGKASVMPLRQEGGIRTEGIYPKGNAGGFMINSRQVNLFDTPIMRRDDKAKHVVASDWT
jgi:hypothetical protein